MQIAPTKAGRAEAEAHVGNDSWWRHAVIYQLVVPSFLDTNHDGYGDLEGIVARLDYLAWLGIDAVWLSPIYASPFDDLGYDVEDYCSVAPRFGSLETFDRLLEAAHARNIRVILDWVPNHTSDRHPWFVESRSSRDSAKRPWYFWRDARGDGEPPNNWQSVFGGSVWEWDEATRQYYLHTFLASQPDLNWREPAVAEAMTATLRFWLERGVDGFRIDAADLMLKDEALRDNPPNPDYREGDLPDSMHLPKHSRNQPGLHETLASFRAIVDAYGGDRVLLGEFYIPVEQIVTFYGAERPELQLPLNLTLAWVDWQADAVGEALEEYHALVPEHGWPALLVGTHDRTRIAERLPREQPRIAAMLLLTQRCTPIVYYGDEIGMRGKQIPREEARDPQGRRTGHNRDPARTPMQWAAERNGGFSDAEPWLPVGDDLATANVAQQSDDPRSLLALYRRLIELRTHEPVLVTGAYEPVSREPPLLVYRRRGDGRTLLVVLNFGDTDVEHALAAEERRGTLLLGTYVDRDGERVDGRVTLRADEGVVIALD